METRKYIDCRDQPASKCTLKISGTEDEVIKAATAHIVSAHEQKDTPELRNNIRLALKPEWPDRPNPIFDTEPMV